MKWLDSTVWLQRLGPFSSTCLAKSLPKDTQDVCDEFQKDHCIQSRQVVQIHENSHQKFCKYAGLNPPHPTLERKCHVNIYWPKFQGLKYKSVHFENQTDIKIKITQINNGETSLETSSRLSVKQFGLFRFGIEVYFRVRDTAKARYIYSDKASARWATVLRCAFAALTRLLQTAVTTSWNQTFAQPPPNTIT